MGLYPHQHEAAGYHLRHRYSLNFSEMGTGKSRMALAAAKESGETVVVFGPAFLESTWRHESEAMGVPIRYVPYSRLSGADLAPYGFWIADECHYLKNPEAKRTAAFYSALKEHRPPYFIGMTGTPIKNRVPDIWTLLGFCAVCPEKSNGLLISEMHPRYHAFARHFCEVKRISVHGRTIDRYQGLKPGMESELKALLRDKAIRFRLAEVVKDLPEMARKHVALGLEEPEGLAEEFAAYVSGKKSDSRAKHLSASLKAPATVEYTKALIEGGSGPVVVFSDHIAPVTHFAEQLGALAVTGAMAADYRAKVVAEFQTGRVKVLAATIGSLSVGVTLTASRHVVFNDLSWVPGDNWQAEKRIHRIGQRNACTAHYMQATETDAFIWKTVEEKRLASERALGHE